MPKDAKQCNNSSSIKNKHDRHHPYYNPSLEGSTSKDGEIDAQKKEWDDAVCPICMEHPHNAVLLVCSSYDNGCCPYMCDTSYRHSNCLDQYRKPRSNCRTLEAIMDNAGTQASGVRALTNFDEIAGTGGQGNTRVNPSDTWASSSEALEDSPTRSALQSGRTSSRLIRQDANGAALLMNTRHHRSGTDVFLNDDIELKCPLCRGTVNGWKVVEAAREYLNMKTRNCSHESCAFNGTYEELRKHARTMHPTARPADVDPTRQRAWRHLEHQRDFGDVLSTIRSAMPRAVVLGDYVLENEDDARGFPARWRAARRQLVSPGEDDQQGSDLIVNCHKLLSALTFAEMLHILEAPVYEHEAGLPLV
ncbi:hypothetical protein SUGI_0920320 [Cryptomeria japonica]|nr:hypothetical protein SUGI_0920320 [Cryptomeria japonica]